jgi:hypothetical protein
VADVQQVAEAAGPYGIAGAILVAAIKLGPIARQIYDVLVAIWEQREIDREQHSKMPSVDFSRREEAAPIEIEAENTDVVHITEVVQKRRPGLRVPRPGTHHYRSNGED